MSRTLPHDAEGYAVEPDTRTVHSRYARHAEGFPRTRRIAGVYAHLGGLDPIPCEDCYPPPVPERKPDRKRHAPSLATHALARVMEEAEIASAFGGGEGEWVVEEPNVEPVAFEDIPVEGDVS